jgi:light-regulated signal transduction histidine kinase (bacteriophytochrome)
VVRTGFRYYDEQINYHEGVISGAFEVHAFSTGRQRVAVFFSDITERKKMQDEIAQRTTDLERSNQELERFAYVASHDLQEPLRMIAGYAELLEKRYKEKLDHNAEEFIGFIVDGADRLQKLIRDLLSYSRVDTRGKPFQEVSCEEALQQALTNLHVALEESRAEISHDPLPTLAADSLQLVQLFQNLVGNAIKFHGREQPRVHIGVEEREGEWEVSVRDNGIGIDPKYFDQIFVIFKRLHGRTNFPGTGIGLALCKKIVERHQGKIWVESSPNLGATFYFTLPKTNPTTRRKKS